MATSKAHDLSRLLADGVVGSTEIGDAQVTNAKIEDNAVTTAKIANGAVTSDKLNVQGSDIPYDNTTSGISANTLQEAIDYLNVLSGGGSAGAQATYTRDSFSATSGQTSFTTSNGYTLGYVQVFLNGVLLALSDYTANDESTVVLSVGASLGDEVVIIAYDSFAISEVLRVLDISASAPDDAVTVSATSDIITSGYMAGDAFHAGSRTNPYTSLSETRSGAMSILGHNAMAHPSNDNVVEAQQNGYHSHFMKMYYSDGISFHTSSGTRLAGDVVYDHLVPANVASGTSEKMRIDPLGRVTTPSQPGFFARRSNHVTNSGDIVFDAEAFDTTNSHNNTNGRFTAPVSGVYLITFSTLLYNMGGSSHVQLHVNGSSYGGTNAFGTYGSFTGSYAGQGASAAVYMNAGDYVTMYMSHSSTNLHGGYTWWSGYLLG